MFSSIITAWIIVSSINTEGQWPQDRFVYADFESCKTALVFRSAMYRCAEVRLVKNARTM